MPQMSQADIVRDSLLREKTGPEQEKINIPGLASLFEEKPIGTVELKRTIRLTGISRAGKSRESIAEMLVLVFEQEPGITGFKWNVKSDNVEITYAKGFRQKNADNKEDLLEYLNLFMKLRKNMKGMEWVFGKEYITIDN